MFFHSLFHVVVEKDEISTQIIRHLNSQKGGRVTFIPLNRVKFPHVTYPQSSDVIPLLKKLNFSPKFTPAFAQVGSSGVCSLNGHEHGCLQGPRWNFIKFTFSFRVSFFYFDHWHWLNERVVYFFNMRNFDSFLTLCTMHSA